MLIAVRVPSLAKRSLFPYTTLFRSGERASVGRQLIALGRTLDRQLQAAGQNSGALPNVLDGFEGVLAAKSEISSRLQRSEEHTSELQSPCNLVCRLLLEKKNKKANS